MYQCTARYWIALKINTTALPEVTEQRKHGFICCVLKDTGYKMMTVTVCYISIICLSFSKVLAVQWSEIMKCMLFGICINSHHFIRWSRKVHVSIMKEYSWSINQPAGRLPLFTPTLKLLLVQSAPAHKVTYHSCESWARHAGWESSLVFTTHWFVCWIITCRFHDSAGPQTYDLWPFISLKVSGTDDKNVACLVQWFKAYWYI